MSGLDQGGASAPPVRLSGLGEERVQKALELDHVTIIGMGGSAMDWITQGYDQHHRHTDPKHEIWTINAAAFTFRHHRSFNIHDFTWDGRAPGTAGDHRRYLEIYKDHPLPVVTCRALEELPCTLEYPIAEVISTFKSSYLANTVSYVIAFAILCNVNRIDLFGCDYNYKVPGRENPYEHGRCNVEYWIGIAKAVGINVTVCQSSWLMDTRGRLSGQEDLFYGYGPAQPMLEIMDNGAYNLAEFQQPGMTGAAIEDLQATIDKNKG